MDMKAMKKKGKELDPLHKEAKMGILKDIHKMASDAMSGDVKGLKKVEVAASDKAGLEQGLDKAKEMLAEADEEKHEDGSENTNNSTDLGEEGAKDQTPDDHSDEDDNLKPELAHDDLSDDQIDMLIKALEARKSKA